MMSLKDTRENLCFSAALALLLLAWGGSAAEGPAAVTVGEFTVKPPADWEAVAGRSPMRAAQFKVVKEGAAAEVIFFYFGPGGAGGVQANVDRWFGQFQEPKDQLKAKTEEIKAGERKATFVQAEGTYLSGPPGGQKTAEPNSMMLAAILEGKTQGPVFIKMTGPKGVVEEARQPFRKMVEEALKQP